MVTKHERVILQSYMFFFVLFFCRQELRCFKSYLYPVLNQENMIMNSLKIDFLGGKNSIIFNRITRKQFPSNNEKENDTFGIQRLKLKKSSKILANKIFLRIHSTNQ